MHPVLHEEEQKAMCVLCYTLCGVSIAICLALFIYVFLR
jgi:hypothetical protein